MAPIDAGALRVQPEAAPRPGRRPACPGCGSVTTAHHSKCPHFDADAGAKPAPIETPTAEADPDVEGDDADRELDEGPDYDDPRTTAEIAAAGDVENRELVDELEPTAAEPVLESAGLTLAAPLEQQEWFVEMIDECQTIIVETQFRARWELIEGYHQLGERLLADHDNFERAGIYGQEITSRVSQSLGKSVRTVERAMQFVRQYPDLNTLPGGKNISWRHICNELLPAAGGSTIESADRHADVAAIASAIKALLHDINDPEAALKAIQRFAANALQVLREPSQANEVSR